jgi:hypothetical protein
LEFYHFDRLGNLKEGDSLSLSPISINSELKGLKNHAAELFENGVSRFGLNYLNQVGTPETTREWFWEYIRRSNYAHRPSRFQSFFGFATLEDIEVLKRQFKVQNGNTYIIKCDKFFKADMNLVSYQNSPMLLSWLADTYWTGNTIDELNAKFNRKPVWEYLLTGEVKVVRKIE